MTRRVLIVLIVPVALGVGLLAGLIWYAADIPVASSAEDSRRVDAIVVLTGGSERLLEGIDLLKRDLGAVLFISGVPSLVEPEHLWQALGITPAPEVAARVVLGHAAADTQGNALETRAWVRANGIRSLRLVTAAYHMRRALLEFRALMPEITMIPHPVYPPHVKQEEWWRFPGTAGLLAREYAKYLVALARVALGLPPADLPEEPPPGLPTHAPLAADPSVPEPT
nr:YdcF family protein [Roseospira navarrensis]